MKRSHRTKVFIEGSHCRASAANTTITWVALLSCWLVVRPLFPILAHRSSTLRIRDFGGIGVIFLSLFICINAVSVQAQPVVGAGLNGASSLTSSAAGRFGGHATTTSSVSGALGTQNNPAPFQWGIVEIRPNFSYRIVYGDGIQASPGNQQSSLIQTIAPGVVIRIGDHWSVDYAANQTLYSQSGFKDSLNHSLGLKRNDDTTFSLGGWDLQFQQNYAGTSEILAETGSQTQQDVVTTSLGTVRSIGRYLSLSLGLTQSLRFAGALGNTFEWTTTDWLNYQQVREFGAGIGVGAGYVDISKSPNSSFWRALGRASWQLSPKTGLDVDGGLETRKSSSIGAIGASNLIYNIAIRNAPFEHTIFVLTAGRKTTISLFQNAVSEGSLINLSLSQRLLGKLQFSAQVEQQEIAFSPQGNSIANTRNDEKRSINLGLSAMIRKRGTMGITYQRSTNRSNLVGFGFSSSQYGLQAAWSY